MGTWVRDWVIFAGQTTIHPKMEGETKIRTVPLSTSMNILFSEKKNSFNQQGGDSKGATSADQASYLFVDIWFRTDITMVMYLSNGTIQVCIL